MRPHGYARYKTGCRCNLCGWGASEYNTRRNREIAAGTWLPYVDVTPALEHLAALSAVGIGYKRAAQLAGVHPSTLNKMLYGNRRRARLWVVEALLAVKAEPTPRPPQGVDATGTARRIGALAALGWTLTDQAREIGWAATQLSAVRRSSRVYPSTARTVADMYDRLSMVTPPDGNAARRAKLWAARRGFPPPLAWDDDTIDDPTALPAGVPPRDPREVDPVRVRYACAGKPVDSLTPVERHAAAVRLKTKGASFKEIKRRVHVDRRTVHKLLREAS